MCLLSGFIVKKMLAVVSYMYSRFLNHRNTITFAQIM